MVQMWQAAIGSEIRPTMEEKLVQNLGSNLLTFENVFPSAQDDEEFNRFDQDDDSDFEEQSDVPVTDVKGGDSILDYLYGCIRQEIEGNYTRSLINL